MHFNRRLGILAAVLLICLNLAAVCYALPLFQLPDKLLVIKEEAFCGTQSIFNVKISDSTQEIRSRAFADSSLSEIFIPESVTFISDDIFEGCDSISVTAVQGSYAYNWALDNGYLSSEITQVSSFRYTLIDDSYIRIDSCVGSREHVVIPGIIDGYPVHEIADRCFDYDTSIASIYMSNNIKSIGSYAFAGCVNLSYLRLPNQLESIGALAFQDCSSLTNVSLPDSLTDLGAQAFQDCSSLTSVTLPQSLPNLGFALFSGCTGLTSIELPDNITEISDSLFNYCNSLSQIDIPSTVTSIGNNSFSGCSMLKEITIPNSVLSIGQNAFKGCSGLTEINLPEGIDTLQYYAFRGCTNLQTIYLPASLTTMQSGLFEACSDVTAYVWTESVAHQWCVANNINFSLLDAESTPSPTATPEPTPEPDAGPVTYRAVLIGNTYPGTENELCAPDDDLIGMEKMLELQSDTPFAVTAKLNVTKSGLLSTITQALGNADHNDISLFYFNGHGVNSTSIEYLGALYCVDGNYVTVSELRSQLDTIPGTKVVLLDCCHSGAHISKSVSSSAASFNNSVIAAFSAQKRSNLATNNYIVLTACSQTESSWERYYGKQGFGFFTYGICKGSGLDFPNRKYCQMYADAYGNNDGCISLNEAYSYARDLVLSYEATQNVQYYGDADFILWSRSEPYDPDAMPTLEATPAPSDDPTTAPSGDPTTAPSDVPTTAPSGDPTTAPSDDPTTAPSGDPTTAPSGDPTTAPSDDPTTAPSGDPTPAPSGDPTTAPSGDPEPTVSPVPEMLYSVISDACAELLGINPQPSGELLLYPVIDDSYLITAIGDNAFEGYDNLTSIALPRYITSIGSYAFANCDMLTELNIPSAVTSIGNGSFQNCSSLVSVTIPESVSTIGSDVFSGCPNLMIIVYPNSFGETYCKENGYTYSYVDDDRKNFSISGTTLTDYTGDATEVVVPEGITRIGYDVFAGNSSLTKVTLPDSVQYIEEFAFYSCTSLSSINVPSSLISIGNNAFQSCKFYEFTLPDTVVSIGKSAFQSCRSLLAIEIPEGVTRIEDDTFYYCDNLESITLPDTLTYIGDRAFYQCNRWTSYNLDLPDGITEIGDHAFYSCKGLYAIDMPTNLISIGEYAFYDCNSIITLTLHEGLESIGDFAFYRCQDIAKLSIPSSVNSIGTDTFKSCSSSLIFYVYDNSYALDFCISKGYQYTIK